MRPYPSLVVLAGKEAYQRIRHDGLSPDDISHMGAAAGGPKWLILNRLDRALFGEWFRGRSRPLITIGSSIGNWRLACAAQRDPIKAIDRFEAAYIEQRYGLKPGAREVSVEAERILKILLGDGGVEEILAHPWLRLNIITARGRGWIGSKTPLLQKTALLGALLSNLASRRLLGLWMQRVILHSPGSPAVAFEHDGFGTQDVALSAENLASALMASAAIPMVMSPVHGIPGAPAGAYLDGGMIDYHMDLPLTQPEGIVFLPHFDAAVTTGWLDKFLPWRKPQHMDKVLLVAPSKEFLATLPNGKIPDRHDFWLYSGRDDERIRDWKMAVAAGQRLADEFMELSARNQWASVIAPFEPR